LHALDDEAHALVEAPRMLARVEGHVARHAVRANAVQTREQEHATQSRSVAFSQDHSPAEIGRGGGFVAKTVLQIGGEGNVGGRDDLADVGQRLNACFGFTLV
jgi:hypothetical protein